MEVKIISYKLLLISIIFAIVIISINIFSNQTESRATITICNEQDRLNIYVRYYGYDFIISPTSLKNMTYCLGKSMPFNDRKIEYVINATEQFKKEIIKRYTVDNFITKDTLKVGQIVLFLKKNKVEVINKNRNIFIHTRPLTSILYLPEKGLSTINLLIRPLSSDDIESLLNRLGIEQHKVLNGEYDEINF